MTFHARDETPAASLSARAGTSLAPQNEADLWASFAGAQDAEAFCGAWLALQGTQIQGARAALLLVRQRDGIFAPAAVWPDRSRDVRHLVPAAETALRERKGHVLRGGTAGAGLLAQVAYPLLLDGEAVAAVVVEVLVRMEAQVAAASRQLHWGIGWLEVLFRRERQHHDRVSLARSHFALDVMAVAAEHRELGALSRAVTTALATRLEARSVAVGLLRNGRVQLSALSHGAGFERTSALVAALENAMEEAIDQLATVQEPPPAQGPSRIALAHRDFLAVSRSGAAVTVPLFSAGQAVGALTVEYEEAPPDAARLTQIESVAALVGPLFELHRSADRWLSGRLVSYAGKGAHALLGPRRPGVKLLAGLGVAGLAALFLMTAPFRVGATAVLEGAVQRAAVAPFEGFVASAPVRAGDRVEEGQVLATLDDRDLQLEAARWRSEREQQLLRYQEALGKRERATARITEALVRQAEAQLALIEARIERAKIRAPFAGLVVSGDLSQQLGTPVERGKLLFEIAPLDRFRVILQVDERDIAHIRAGQGGNLLLKGLPQQPVPIAVTAVTPVASAGEGRNTFRVEAALTGGTTALRPGMEGVAKLDVDERRLLWIWTRPLLDWARLTWWSWVR